LQKRQQRTSRRYAGLSEKEAMEISGHKTRAVFDRYHIVSERRMKQNAQKLEDHLKAKETTGATDETGEDTGGRQPRAVN
jgi:hypothetical protein